MIISIGSYSIIVVMIMMITCIVISDIDHKVILINLMSIKQFKINTVMFKYM